MKTKNPKIDKRLRLKKKIRSKISGTNSIPRLTVFKSNMHIYAQIIDDVSGKTLAQVSDLALRKEKKGTSGTYRERAVKIGKDIWPYQLYITVKGAEEIIKDLKAKGSQLTFNFNDISKNQSVYFKLLSLGVLPGDVVQILGKAPFNGPITIKHKSETFFALRRKEASTILAQKVEN